MSIQVNGNEVTIQIGEGGVVAAAVPPTPPAELVLLGHWPGNGSPVDVVNGYNLQGNAGYADGVSARCFNLTDHHIFLPPVNVFDFLETDWWKIEFDLFVAQPSANSGFLECSKDGNAVYFVGFGLRAYIEGWQTVDNFNIAILDTSYYTPFVFAAWNHISIEYKNGVRTVTINDTVLPPQGGVESILVNTTGSQINLVASGVACLLSDFKIYGKAPSTTPSAPTIITSPQSQSINLGDNFSLGVFASGVPRPTYQWKKGGEILSGKTSNPLVINAVTDGDAGDYTCVVTNSDGSVESDAATLTVIDPTANFRFTDGTHTFPTDSTFDHETLVIIDVSVGAISWNWKMIYEVDGQDTGWTSTDENPSIPFNGYQDIGNYGILLAINGASFDDLGSDPRVMMASFNYQGSPE